MEEQTKNTAIINVKTNTITPKIKWTSQTEYVDIDTGEIITKKQQEKEYIIIKTKKHVKINNENNIARVRYTNECTKTGKQKKLF